MDEQQQTQPPTTIVDQSTGQPPVSTSTAPQQPKSNNKSLIIALVVWLGSLPLVVIVQMIVRFFLAQSGSDEANESISVVINIISLLVGIYGVLGWIPVVIIAISNSKHKA